MTAHQQWWNNNGSPPIVIVSPPSTVEANLYVSFRETDPDDWHDQSTDARVIDWFPNSGSFASDPTGPIGYPSGRVVQLVPGNRATPAYTETAYGKVHGAVNLADQDFFIEFRINLDAGQVPINWGFSVIDCHSIAGGGGGWFVELLGNTIDFSDFRLVFSSTTTSSHTRQIAVDNLTPNTQYAIGISRKGTALTAFINGVVTGQSSSMFTDGEPLADSALDYIRLFAGNTGPDTPVSTIDGFDGQITELIVQTGPGTGRDSTYTPRLVPYAI